ncbi:MAG: hypothetical protein FWG38_11510 [Defluviitaleaceae bacterium]|nr:hypothetical protein [Defluviitaleaceae bacterium]
MVKEPAPQKNESTNKESLSQTQSKSRPKINDVIGDVLSGEKLQLALDFITYLKEQKLNLSWASANTWHVKYKGNVLLWIRLTGAEFFTHRNHIENGSWMISPPFDGNDSYEEYQSDASFNTIVWNNINYCVGCIKCKPGNTYNILGKKFDNVCNGRIAFVNPDADAIDCVKKLIAHSIKASEIHGTPKKPLLDPATVGFTRIDNSTNIQDVTGTDSAPAGNLFNLKYAMFHCRTNCDVLFTTNQPIALKMYGLVTYKEDKLPSRWTLYGAKSENDAWETLDIRTKDEAFTKPIAYYAEKAFEIAEPRACQYYKLEFEGAGLYFLSQVHLYV